MSRKLFDILTSTGGAVVVVVLLVAGGLLTWGHSFVNSNVRSQLAQQQIFFPSKAAFAHAKPGTEITLKLEDGKTMKRVALMGTDSLGRDVYSRVLYGTRVSLMVGASVAVVAVPIGLVIGLVSGYIRWLDGIIMRIMDGLMAIPGILLAIALVSIWRAGVITVIFAIVVPDVPRVVRLVRSVVLTVREEPYVEGAISVGTPTWTLMFRHILPKAAGSLVVATTMSIGTLILLESTLSFLGLGTQPPAASWGNMLTGAQELLQQAPVLALWPGLLIFLTVIAFNFVGDGLQDALDPRSERR